MDLSWMLKFSAMTVLLAISPFISFMFLGASIVGTYMLMNINPLLVLILIILNLRKSYENRKMNTCILIVQIPQLPHLLFYSSYTYFCTFLAFI